MSRRNNDTTVYQTHSKAPRWEDSCLGVFCFSRVGKLHRINCIIRSFKALLAIWEKQSRPRSADSEWLFYTVTSALFNMWQQRKPGIPDMTRSSLDDFQKVRGRERMNYSPWKKRLNSKQMLKYLHKQSYNFGFSWYIRLPTTLLAVCSCIYLIYQSHGSKSLHLCMQRWSRRATEVQTKQTKNLHKRGFKWLWMVFGDGQAARVYREWPKKRKYPASCGSLGENDARGKRRMAIPLLSC